MYKRPEAPRAGHFLGKLQKSMATWWDGLAVCDYHGVQYTFGDLARKIERNIGILTINLSHSFPTRDVRRQRNRGGLARLDRSRQRILKGGIRRTVNREGNAIHADIAARHGTGHIGERATHTIIHIEFCVAETVVSGKF